MTTKKKTATARDATTGRIVAALYKLSTTKLDVVETTVDELLKLGRRSFKIVKSRPGPKDMTEMKKKEKEVEDLAEDLLTDPEAEIVEEEEVITFSTGFRTKFDHRVPDTNPTYQEKGIWNIDVVKGASHRAFNLGIHKLSKEAGYALFYSGDRMGIYYTLEDLFGFLQSYDRGLNMLESFIESCDENKEFAQPFLKSIV